MYNAIINLAVEAGRIILESGGETYRVEETIVKICNAFGIKNCDSYVTPTGIIVSVEDKDGKTASIVKRVLSRTVNLEKISEVNNLSRTIYKNKMSLDEFKQKLIHISRMKSYKSIVLNIFAGVASSFFTIIFGGNIKEFFISFLAGFIINYMTSALSKMKLNEFFINIIASAVSALITLIFLKMGIITRIDKVIIGSIMLLVPGIAITNAVRDTIEGNLIAGISKGVEAVFVAVAIAIGTGSMIKICFLLFGKI